VTPYNRAKPNAKPMTANPPAPFQRIAVVGASGSGKTTLAQTLARRLGVPHIELDSLYWEANWQPAPLDIFRAHVEPNTAAPAWVTDGNYRQARDLVWGRATALVWLDYPLPLIFWRLTLRTVSVGLTRRLLWNKNRQSLTSLILTRDSLFYYALRSHPRQRREYPELLAAPAYNHLHVVRLLSPKETQSWLAPVPATK
jgi:adenylate kinase family enzyme